MAKIEDKIFDNWSTETSLFSTISDINKNINPPEPSKVGDPGAYERMPIVDTGDYDRLDSPDMSDYKRWESFSDVAQGITNVIKGTSKGFGYDLDNPKELATSLGIDAALFFIPGPVKQAFKRVFKPSSLNLAEQLHIAQKSGKTTTFYRGVNEWHSGKMVVDGKHVSPAPHWVDNTTWQGYSSPTGNAGTWASPTLGEAMSFAEPGLIFKNLSKRIVASKNTGISKRGYIIKFDIPDSWLKNNMTIGSGGGAGTKTSKVSTWDIWFEGGIPEEFMTKVYKEGKDFGFVYDDHWKFGDTRAKYWISDKGLRNNFRYFNGNAQGNNLNAFMEVGGKRTKLKMHNNPEDLKFDLGLTDLQRSKSYTGVPRSKWKDFKPHPSKEGVLVKKNYVDQNSDVVKIFRGYDKWHKGTMTKDGNFVGGGGPAIGAKLGMFESMPPQGSLYGNTNFSFADEYARINFNSHKQKLNYLESNNMSPLKQDELRTLIEKGPGPVLEFHIPMQWFKKNSIKSKTDIVIRGANSEGTSYAFPNGIPKSYLKKVHQNKK